MNDWTPCTVNFRATATGSLLFNSPYTNVRFLPVTAMCLAFVCLCICVCMCVCAFVCACVFVHLCVQACVCAYVCLAFVCACVFVHLCVHTYVAVTGRKRTLFHSKWVKSISYIYVEITQDFSKFQSHSYWQSLDIAVWISITPHTLMFVFYLWLPHVCLCLCVCLCICVCICMCVCVCVGQVRTYMVWSMAHAGLKFLLIAIISGETRTVPRVISHFWSSWCKLYKPVFGAVGKH